MRRIEEIDKNFIVKNEAAKEGTRVYDAEDAPFSLHGIFPPKEDGVYYRLPEDIAKNVNEGVLALSANGAGGRVRFKTNSSYIAIKAVLGNIGKMSHFALTGSAGFDLYAGSEHIATFQPQFDIENQLFGERNVTPKLREYTLNFPLYSEVKKLYIILDEDAALEAPSPYKNEKPVVYYGSSITQGGCASRPGTAYPAIVSRNLDLDYINLGFSGSARGEKEIAKYIKNLDMLAFVFDYDHNAPTAGHLEKTHETFFKIIRSAHPDIPVICMTQPFPCFDDFEKRKQIIQNTVKNAKASGDENVYFIDMTEYFEKNGITNEATVDRCHPNDLGFYFMAKATEDILKKAKF